MVRVWLEDDPDDGGLRARITHTLDLVEGEEVVVAAAATIEDVYVAVRVWLEGYLAQMT